MCGLTTKNYNKVFVQQLKRLGGGKLTPGVLLAALSSLEGDASRWPRDDEFRKAFLDDELYPGRLDPTRTKAVLAELETAMRSPRTEEPAPIGLDNLDVDHILSVSWWEYWLLPDGTSAKDSEVDQALRARFSDQPLPLQMSAILGRERAKATLGNLTLLHYGVNRSLKNHAFPVKRERLFSESNLHLNRSLMRVNHWDEDHIERRGRELFEIAKQVWHSLEA